MPGDGPYHSPGACYPAAVEVACPECGESFMTDPPHPWHLSPCRECGYAGDR